MIDRQMKLILSWNTTALGDNPALSPADSITRTVPMSLNTPIVTRAMTRHHSERARTVIGPFGIVEVLVTGTMMAMRTLGVAGLRGNLTRASVLVLYVIDVLQPFSDDTTAGRIRMLASLTTN